MMSERSNSIDDDDQSRCCPGLECDEEKIDYCDNEGEDEDDLKRIRKQASHGGFGNYLVFVIVVRRPSILTKY